ncbi:MAG: C1 family peptidase [Acholeplasmatales bacterium]|jgi:bleomycin hydrolase|nr:C1 family peptidase [Acholeplasmatales bacterium]
MLDINHKLLVELQEKYNKKSDLKKLSYLLDKGSLFDILNVQNHENTNFIFSKEIKTLNITNQKASGRCWIFAGLNFLREKVVTKYGITDSSFELSENYVAFYDKLEKINFFIESIDDFLTCDQDDRTLRHILSTGVQDGGQWDMFVSVVKKYGIVPKYAMEETFSSSATKGINSLINLTLKKYAFSARKLGSKDKIKELKITTLDNLYSLLCLLYGNPPKNFSFEYLDKDKEYHQKYLTPLELFEETIGSKIDDYISIINAPTKDKPFYKTFTVSYLGNVVSGKEIFYLNLEIDELQDLVSKQIEDGEIVWFGADVSQFHGRQDAIFNDLSYPFDDIIGYSTEVSKETSLDYGISQMNHAMCFTGLNKIDGKVNRYKVENSWGTGSLHLGYWVMSKTWFEKFVFQVVIDKKYLNEKQLKALNEKPIVLLPWDPMGSLAD